MKRKAMPKNEKEESGYCTSGRLVAPTITTLADRSVPAPSSCTKNSVLMRLEASFSSELL